jgi:hypothetical protein
LERYDDAADTIKRMIALECHCEAGGDGALCQLFEELMARSGEATMLGWSGQSSSYNSCLPASLSFDPQPHKASLAIEDTAMDERVSELKISMSQTEATLVYNRVIRLPLARFADRRLYLPCIFFPVKKLAEKFDAEIGEGKCFGARVSGIGHVEFRMSDTLSVAEPCKLLFVHPWIRDLRGALDEVDWGNPMNRTHGLVRRLKPILSLELPPPRPLLPCYDGPVATMDDYTRALQLVVRLQQLPCEVLSLAKNSSRLASVQLAAM